MTRELSFSNSKRTFLINTFFLIWVFIVFVSVLWYHAAPSVSFHDSGEFALAAACGGLPHPPGAPTWALGASLFYRIGKFTDAAYACNLYAGMWGAVTLTLMCLLSLYWLNLYTSFRHWHMLLLSLVPSLVLLHSPAFLEQSLITEQYTLMTAIMIGMIILFVRGTAVLAAGATSKSGIAGNATCIGILWGLALGNHMSQVCLVIPISWFLYVTFRTMGRQAFGAALLGTATGLALGLSIFLYLPYVNRKQPLMDWVQADTWDRFMWAIQRKLWKRREIADAPDHFVTEWLLTYDLIGQLGFLAFFLSLLGLVVCILRFRAPLMWVVLVAAPYLAGLLYGHLTQQGMTLYYIRYYGIQDWHLPLYFTGAFLTLAGFSTLLYKAPQKSRDTICVLSIAVLTGFAARSVATNSVRSWEGPDKFLEALKTGVEEPYMMLLYSDNATNMLAYDTYFRHPAVNRQMVYNFMQAKPRIEPGTTRLGRLTPYVRDSLTYKYNVLNYDLLNVDLNKDWNVYVDYASTTDTVTQAFLKPAGFLYTYTHDPLTSAALYPQQRIVQEKLSRFKPGEKPHRLEREAFGMQFWDRGNYFMWHDMYDLAIENYKIALEWTPDNGFVWLSLGRSLFKSNPDKRIAFKQALQAFDIAQETIPREAAPWYERGTLLVNMGHVEEGIKSLQRCLEIDPAHEKAKINLRYATGLQ